MKPKLTIVTGNTLKFQELSVALGEFFDCEQKVLKGYSEIQGKPEEILRHKLEAAYREFQEPVLVDDTSLHFETLNGFPGPYIKDFLECFSPYQMGMKFVGTRVSLACRLGLYTGVDKPTIGIGIIAGDVVEPKPIDPGLREFDLFIKADGTDKVMLEFTIEEKNTFSHRGLAIKNLLEQLKKQNNI